MPMLQIDKLRHQGCNRLSRSPSDGAVVLERKWESGAEFCLSLVMLWCWPAPLLAWEKKQGREEINVLGVQWAWGAASDHSPPSLL